MQSLYGMIESVGPSDTPVMILGESGTGKEMVAKALHETGPRSSGPFIKVNCAALSENLLESELFGHVKGAYTGADQKRIGRFEASHNGTIFLDEVGDIPMSVQVKLLRVLEDKRIERVGDNQSVPVDVRIITATNRDLEVLIQEDRFREDLYFRINVFPITCPPLRERKEDIPVIAQHFLNLNVEKTGKNILGFTPDAMQIIVNYHWPGNVRELRNTVEYAVVLATGSSIGPEHLPGRLMEKRSRQGAEERPDPAREENQRRPESEREQLIRVLRQTGGNQSKAAGILGVSRVTVWKRIKKHGIDLAAEI
jgi:transcriptional regulator with GAF, ATPase, and Fis domain